ncbi:MAG: hypothetical protein HKP58_10760 [Desulfatitalea sp.]|nr:hypothetical protein [Desulfatitalea sp.]NNK00880.1 hypothetical protein [Desulfatitalea sp.]
MGFTTKRTMWYELGDLERTGDSGLRAVAFVPADSPWFDGHFPGRPVLPGIAQLGMVLALISKATGTALFIRQVGRVRFKRVIPPGSHLTLYAEAKPGKAGQYLFRIEKGSDLVCSGNMTVAGKN